jgi:hypothetical protein
MIFRKEIKIVKKLAYKFQKPDSRDYLFIAELDVVPEMKLNAKAVVKVTENLPVTFSLRSSMSPILDQGNLGDCVSNAFALTLRYMSKNKLVLSRLFHYAITRIIENTAINDDSGVYLRDAAKVVANYGVTSESLWPYVNTMTNFAILPPLNVFRGCEKLSNFFYYKVNQSLTSLKQALLTNKCPIIFGLNVYSSFMMQSVSKNGFVPLPDTSKETLDGGHCMAIVGYDDAKIGWNNTKGMFICANSWGTGWGDAGYCYIPYAFMTNPNFASDFLYLSFTY